MDENKNSSSEECSGSKQAKVVLVTGAAGNIGYAILFSIASGRLLGDDQPIELRLLDIPPMAEKMNGVMMELEDCAFPMVTKLVATTDYKTAFTGIDLALLIGARPRSKGMVRADLLKANASIFAGQGKAIEQYSPRHVRVVVVGNPANTNCLICMKNAPSVSPKNFSAMTRLDQNRARGLLASKIGTPVSNVTNVFIWGNHSRTQYPDVSHARVQLAPGLTTSVRSAVNDDEWLTGEFIPAVQQRGAAVIKARGLSSAASAANACVEHARDLMLGCQDIVSMAVLSSGEYGVPKDIIYSFPCRCLGGGEYEIVSGIPISKDSQQRMDETGKELVAERETALSIL